MAPAVSPDFRPPVGTVSQYTGPDPGSSILPYEAWLSVRNSLRLSTRELQIVQAVFDDQEQEEIANAAAISQEAVYRAMQRIYVKLQVGSRAELIVRVLSEYLAYVADVDEPDVFGVLCWPTKAHPSGDEAAPAAEISRAAGASSRPC